MLLRAFLSMKLKSQSSFAEEETWKLPVEVDSIAMERKAEIGALALSTRIAQKKRKAGKVKLE